VRELEHREQCAFIKWVRYAHPGLLVAAIPNGGNRNAITGKKLKDEGVMAGFPDILVARQGKDYPMLFIEMKSAKGRLSESQKEVKKRLEWEGYLVVVCHSWEEAKEAVEGYL
jgi:VRR-NUC domain